MKCKVILTKRLAVEIASELEQTEQYTLVELVNFENYCKAKEYVFNECPYSKYLVIGLEDDTIAIQRDEVNEYRNFTFDRAFPALEMAEEYLLEQKLYEGTTEH